jgi:hypothetical protein
MSRSYLRLALTGSALLLSAAVPPNPPDTLNGTCPGCGPEFIFFDNTANLTATAKGNFVVDPGGCTASNRRRLAQSGSGAVTPGLLPPAGPRAFHRSFIGPF